MTLIPVLVNILNQVILLQIPFIVQLLIKVGLSKYILRFTNSKITIKCNCTKSWVGPD